MVNTAEKQYTHYNIPGTGYASDTYGDLGPTLPREVIERERAIAKGATPSRQREASKSPKIKK